MSDVPQTNLLLEAAPFSLSDAMSKDPESPDYETIYLPRIIEALRAQRARWSVSARPKAGSSASFLEITKPSSEELGF